MALAIAIRCFCPPDNSAPLSPICYIRNNINTILDLAILRFKLELEQQLYNVLFPKWTINK